MLSQKEIVNEIIETWKSGEKESTRLLIKLYDHILDKKIYDYLCDKTGVVENEITPEIAFEAQNIFGGKIFNQYGIEVDDPRIKQRGTRPVFKK